MDVGEFEIGQIKQEVDCDFNKVTQTNTVKNVSCQVDVFSKCGRYDESVGNETQLVHHESATYSYQQQNAENINANKPIQNYVDHSEDCEDVSANEFNTEQIKNETNIDIFYEDIKLEIDEEKSRELSKYCEVCDKSFSSETEFIDSKNNGFECSCQKQTDSINLIDEDEKPFSLTTDFRSQPFLKNDERSNNIPDDSIPQKRKCCSLSAENKVFVNPQGTKTHEMVHAGEKLFHCKICSKTYNKSGHLRIHQKIHTGEIRCKICSKNFIKWYHLKVHERVHTGEKPYNCKICSKTFILNSINLKIHKDIHANERRFACKICSKNFRSSAVLKVHERVHTGENPFYCKICLKTFYMSSSNFKIHESIHIGAKPFFCKICSKYFSSLQYVKIHERVHAEENQFGFQLKIESS